MLAFGGRCRLAGPRLYRIIVPVTDIEQAAAFYAHVLELEGERVSPGRHYFHCGDAILACYHPGSDGDGADLPPLPEHLYIAVSDVAATRSRVQSAPGAAAPGEVATRPWGETSFYTHDPFGNPLCFVAQGTEFLSAR